MIQAEHLSRLYGDFVAVDDVSFSIDHGEVVGLLGHNGAGKTTIMKMLTGYLEPSSGSVTVDGIVVEEDAMAVQRQLGYLSENLPLYPELRVIDYLSYIAELRGVQVRSAVVGAIAATELEEKALDPIATLSRGFKQRVGVAQAILHKPRFLILDEPTNGLDPGQTQHMRQLLRDLASSATVILSTHIMQEVSAICDRALILRGGALVLDERLDDLQRSGALSLRTAPDVEVARLISGEVEDLGEGNWRIEVVDGVDAQAERIARELVAADAPVYELLPVQRDLETVFREVSEGGAVDAL
ncbi:MAG: ABC transporter ATP-binding protein [Pseudomonadales bacterium]|jgi:ABC-2 type transport system ATP-binding protein|nr:ABC transporter ATP-binding protein [Pseudomonadales bacterium]MDP6470330.1 ABC transporter ATP-binding protein [Pseudomonadales bacterium]MDP6827236.1 ABC transporter ATP-binding protein [Pseudomonadales bacterium]MDP6972461.1 ABC transporter ATP-binding protein [Pseudomonadales bacterium]|tara:strand:+ start:1614 stop:2513 length:900 start_codon:yes stop_codon:yes gene_type:complete